MNSRHLFRLLLLLAALALPAAAQASPFSVNWANEHKMDTLNLWVVNSPGSDVDIVSASMKNRRGRPIPSWETTTTSSMVFAQGSTKNPFRLFADVTFSDDAQDFAVEWAEIRTKGNGQIKQLFTGTNYYNFEHGHGSWTYTQGAISNTPATQAPTPVPGAAWILSSGLLSLMGVRFVTARRNR
jgi:hypothetical protein